MEEGGGRCSADGGERVEGKAGQGCCAACVASAWRPRGERALTLSGAARGNGAAQRGDRPGARAGLGRGERSAGRRGAWAGFGWRARKEAAARERRKPFFKFYFQEIFKYQFSNIILSKKMTSFENVPKIKNCLEFNPLIFLLL